MHARLRTRTSPPRSGVPILVAEHGDPPVTWRGVEDPNANLEELIEGYFSDQKILAASTARLLREHKPIPKAPEPGYDGRLFDWLAEMLVYGPPDGPERAWPIILQLIDRAPDDDALTFI